MLDYDALRQRAKELAALKVKLLWPEYRASELERAQRELEDEYFRQFVSMTDDCKNHDGPPESLFLTCSVCGKNTWIPAKPLGGVEEMEVFIATED